MNTSYGGFFGKREKVWSFSYSWKLLIGSRFQLIPRIDKTPPPRPLQGLPSPPPISDTKVVSLSFCSHHKSVDFSLSWISALVSCCHGPLGNDLLERKKYFATGSQPPSRLVNQLVLTSPFSSSKMFYTVYSSRLETIKKVVKKKITQTRFLCANNEGN